MNRLLFIIWLVAAALVSSGSGAGAEPPFGHNRDRECCSKPGNEPCDKERRGWCGKRKGDWYGARRPVASREDAREQLAKYYSSQQKTVAELAEKPWRFEADLLDNCGKVVDRVMIDKRSGRIRSIY